MAKTSPTQRSLAYLREQGYHCEVVEKFNSFTKQRKDLWGWCDILAIKRNEVLAVQVTAAGVSDRIKKIMASDTLALVREAGIRIEVHGWRKNSKGRYVQRIEDIS
jgi:protein-tyrosine-phosphatase